MNDDVIFLENFLKKQNWRLKKPDETDGSVNDMATDALKYLTERRQFWEQTRREEGTVMKTKWFIELRSSFFVIY